MARYSGTLIIPLEWNPLQREHWRSDEACPPNGVSIISMQDK